MGEGSTGQTELSRKSLQEFVVMVPDVQCQKAVEPVLVSIAEKIVTNTSNSIKVAEVRDLILPKLLSGKLQVPDARKQVDEVL
jgi:type I restriction enzyme S subunit